MKNRNNKRNIFAWIEGFILSIFTFGSFEKEDLPALRIIMGVILVVFLTILLYLFIISY